MASLDKQLDLYLINKNREDRKKHGPLKKNEFYASQAGYCPKSIYLSKTKGEGLHPPSTLKIFLIGNLVEEFLLAKVFPEETETQNSVHVQDGEIFVRGRYDAKVKDIIYEIKSTKKIPKTPYLHHLMQLNIYLKAETLVNGVIVYIEKNTGKIKEFPVDFSEDIYLEAISGFKCVYDAIKGDYTPLGKESFFCISCLCDPSDCLHKRRKQ